MLLESIFVHAASLYLINENYQKPENHNIGLAGFELSKFFKQKNPLHEQLPMSWKFN